MFPELATLQQQREDERQQRLRHADGSSSSSASTSASLAGAGGDGASAGASASQTFLERFETDELVVLGILSVFVVSVLTLAYYWLS